MLVTSFLAVACASDVCRQKNQAAAATPDYCDTSLIPSTRDLQYRFRGNRCEGLFTAKAAAANVGLLSLHVGDLHLNTSASNAVRVMPARNTTNADKCVYLRAVSSRPPAQYPDEHYQMDAKICSGQPFFWPISDVPAQIGLRADDIGVYGWVEANSRREYVPLIVTQDTVSQEGGAPPTKVVLLPLVFFTTLSYTISSETNEILSERKTISLQPFEPVTIELPRSNESLVRIVVQPFLRNFLNPLVLWIRTAH